MKFASFYQEYLNQLAAFKLALETISYEQYTIAPEKGIPYSNKILGILSKNQFEYENNKEIITKLESYVSSLSGLEKKEVSLRLKKLLDQQSLPSSTYSEYVDLINDSMMIWHKAKSENNYDLFKPYLKQVIEKKKEVLSYSKRYNGSNLYDLCLDEYEPGMNQEKYDLFFDRIKTKLLPIIPKQAKGTHLFDKNIDITRQQQFMNILCDFLKIDFSEIRMDTTEHPFTSSFSNHDTRITTHFYEDNVMSAIFSTIHEYGHALYGLQIDDEFMDTMFYEPYCAAHESQSRLMENHIGRSTSFWKALYPKFIEVFDEFKDVSFDEFMDAICTSECSFIRTEADELTYPIHILIRYEIEKKLLNGTVDYDHLNELWNDKYEQYLGIRPENDSQGILQDIHWSSGDFGYFPSYALGSAYAAQLYHAMSKEINVDEALENGHIEVIKDWLKMNVHHYGASKSVEEIVEEVCHEPFNPDYYIDYLIDKYVSKRS